MNNELSLTHLIFDASLLVQLVMAGLMVASVLSWIIIVSKRRMLGRIQRSANRFEDRFWSGGQISEIYDRVKGSDHADHGMEALFLAGYEEYRRQRSNMQQNDDRGADESAAGAVQRAMRVAQMREVDRMEGGLPVLATIGSTSPYVGLFGTVWGIMHAFIAIGNVKQATLAMVAPGIAEALIATAIGLFAAIPAVIAYNIFTSQLDRLESRFQACSEELVGILERGLQSTSRRPEA
ncbi:protein TolQ [Abyssibacter sp.]|uniref:protein TolQ n=1 Tax=Abyssibacter sp. TaxID=2320200 RepID=UPI0035180B4C